MRPEAVRRPREPGKWSPIEILGHLVDSASNNHGRFVRAAGGAPLRFPGYDQEVWVQAQDYASADWSEVLELWSALNLHIARVVDRFPPELMERTTTDHAFHRIAWEVVEEGQPTSLSYFVRDYVNHLKHHLRQIDPELADEPRMQGESGRIKAT